MPDTERTRTISWQDPMASAARGGGLAGLEYLKAIQQGDIPVAPIMALMGLEIAEVEDGRVVFRGEPGEQHYNPIGTVHAGLALTLLDSAMSCAVHTKLPAGARYTTLEVKVNLVKGMTAATGRVLAEGTVVHFGRSTATADGRLIAEDSGKLIAHGMATCMLFPADAPAR